MRYLLIWNIHICTLALFFVLPHMSTAQSIDGVWRSEGYGNVFEVNGTNWKAFEVTTTTCVPGFTAAQLETTVEGRESTFKKKDGDVFFVRTGGSNDHKVLHFDGSASDMRIDRLPDMPSVCQRMTPNTPIDNFEVFTRTWAEQYISFDLKHADWDQVVAINRKKVTAVTSPKDLFDILAGMIEPFGDAHTSIRAPALKKEFDGLRPGTNPKPKDALKVTERAYLKGPLRQFCQNQVQYGHVDDSTGYLRILSFSGYAASGGFAAELMALEAALDTIFSDPNLKALVIDVRINDGGDDPLGLAIASRLAISPYLAYAKKARLDPVNRNKWTEGDESWVRPSTWPGFRGPVVELIGPRTISAGETFTQALMGRSPHITRIGENTQGVFSDVLERHLPNGWTFGLPNEVFFTPEGTAFDGPGIPPDIHVEVFAPADVAAGKDPGMAKALDILRNAGNTAVHDDTNSVYNFFLCFLLNDRSKREMRAAQITGRRDYISARRSASL